MEELLNQPPEFYVSVLTAIVTIASLVANVTPTDKDNKALAFIDKLVNFLALNWSGKKAPKSDRPEPPAV
jgi:hypothetical protein